MIVTRAGAAVLVFCLGALPVAAEQARPAGIGTPMPAEMLRLAADTRKVAAKEQLRSRTAQREGSGDRVAKLERRVAELEAQIERLLSVLEVDGQDVTIQARRVWIEGQQSVDLRAPQTAVESQAKLQLKAPAITLNGGSKPIARVGSAVSAGVVSNGASTVLAP